MDMRPAPIVEGDPPTRQALKVVVIVPRGLSGRGGIERLFLYVSRHFGEVASFRYLTSRGDGERSSLLVFIGALATFIGLLVRGEVDVVHINLSVKGSVYRKVVFAQLAKLFRKPIVIHYHGGGLDKRIGSKLLWVRLTRFLLRQADLVLALGERWRHIFVDEFGVDPKRVQVVYNAVPDFTGGMIEARPMSGPLHICFAGEVGQRKGVDILVAALSKLDEDVDWRCTIAGNGDAAAYRKVLVESGRADKVEFTGWIETERMHAILRSADVVVLPSRGEALPISLIEGAAAGAALVTTAAGASAEICENGVSGFVIAPSAEELCDALTMLARDRAMLLRMQSAARARYLERFTVGQMAAGLVKAYKSVL